MKVIALIASLTTAFLLGTLNRPHTLPTPACPDASGNAVGLPAQHPTGCPYLDALTQCPYMNRTSPGTSPPGSAHSLHQFKSDRKASQVCPYLRNRRIPTTNIAPHPTRSV